MIHNSAVWDQCPVFSHLSSLGAHQLTSGCVWAVATIAELYFQVYKTYQEEEKKRSKTYSAFLMCWSPPGH